jgi:hypothetical protein
LFGSGLFAVWPIGALCSHHRQMVDDLGGRANEAIHRLAAAATEELACIFYVATIARWWMTPVQDELSVSLAGIELLEPPLELLHAEFGFF